MSEQNQLEDSAVANSICVPLLCDEKQKETQDEDNTVAINLFECNSNQEILQETTSSSTECQEHTLKNNSSDFDVNKSYNSLNLDHETKQKNVTDKITINHEENQEEDSKQTNAGIPWNKSKISNLEEFMSRKLLKKPFSHIPQIGKPSTTSIKVGEYPPKWIDLNLTHKIPKCDLKSINSYAKLKENLKRLITQKRLEEITKKYSEHNQEKDDECKTKVKKKSNEDSHDDEEEEEDTEDIEEGCDADNEDEDVEEECDDVDNKEEYDVNSEEECDVDSEEEDVEVGRNVDNKNKISPNENSSNSTDNNESNDDELDCKGDVSSPLSKQTGKIGNESCISQIPMGSQSHDVDENELMNLCSGSFPDSQQISSSHQSLDLQNDNNSDNSMQFSTLKENKKLDNTDDDLVRKIKKKPKIVYEYDSDENEIPVNLSENEALKKKMRLKDFLDDEAELSESEWNSSDEDEDERDVDDYEKELGDDDEFDNTRLRSELEKIHLVKVLDEDVRRVKKIQELFLNEEEAGEIGRQKQFKWRNIDNSFNLNVTEQQINQTCDESDDEQTEESCRKVRHEKLQLLNENKIEISSNQILNTKNSTQKKLSILKLKEDELQIDTDSANVKSPFLISKSKKPPITKSFISETNQLSLKLIKIKSDKNDDDDILDSKISNKKNFVFSFTSKEENKKCVKRKQISEQLEETKKPYKRRFLINQN